MKLTDSTLLKTYELSFSIIVLIHQKNNCHFYWLATVDMMVIIIL